MRSTSTTALWLIVTASTLVIASLSACSNTPGSNSSGGSEKKVVLRLADTLPANDIENQSLHMLADQVREKTGGSVDIQLFPDGQLGGEVEAMQQISSGTVQLALAGSTSNAALDAFYTPYAFSSQDELASVIESHKLDKYFDEYRQQRHAVMVGWLTRSPREVTSSTPVRTPADIQGLKIRVAQQESSIVVFKALGTNVTALAFPEVFQALQSGAVAAQENPVELIASSKFYEVQKYLDMTNHVYAPFWIWMNDASWNGLTDKQRSAFQTAMDDVRQSNAKAVEANAQRTVDDLRVKGMQVVQPDNTAFRNAVYDGTVKPYLEKVWGVDVVQSLGLAN
jgi:tripartite ATP-independent transporter DctP family solute receptor